jgi:hypothetical protein
MFNRPPTHEITDSPVGKAEVQPLRQRTRLEADPFETSLATRQNRHELIGVGWSLRFKNDPTFLIHHADARHLQGHVEPGVKLGHHGLPSS